MTRSRAMRLAGVLATAAAGGLMTLAFAAPASAAGTGDWGPPGPDQVVQPGSDTTHTLQTKCLSAGGCDYGNAGLVRAFTVEGTSSLSSLASSTLWLQTGTTKAVVGSCELTQGNQELICSVTATGHADQGALLVSDSYTLHVDAAAGPDTAVEADHVAFMGDEANQDNDYWYFNTPTVADSPIASLGVAGGAIGGIALLAGGVVTVRRRKASVGS